jgi:hypothetical protein
MGCKFHVVFIPKYRRKALYGQIGRELGPVFRTLTERRECRVEEGHIASDHVHMLLSIPPKYAVATIVGFIKDALNGSTKSSAWNCSRRFLPSRKRSRPPLEVPAARAPRQTGGRTSHRSSTESRGKAGLGGNMGQGILGTIAERLFLAWSSSRSNTPDPRPTLVCWRPNPHRADVQKSRDF